MNLQPHLHSFARVIILNTLIQIVLRIVETAIVLVRFGALPSLFRWEITGLFWDIIHTNTILVLLLPLFILLSRFSGKLAGWVFVTLLSLLTISSLLISSYFFYLLIPLDIFLFHLSLREILFTLRTTEVSYTAIFIVLLAIPFLIGFLYHLVSKVNIPKPFYISIYLLLILSMPVSIYGALAESIPRNHFAANKPLYFYGRSINYLVSDAHRSQRLANELREVFKDNPYPLLRDFDYSNPLAPYFNSFERAPNIVIIVVEGLNDDYINSYMGLEFMPFLTNLKERSLYWNRCFTLGERSFAAVPSIVGSLPHGERGFTMLDITPRHFSLVSILNANSYHTAFFYGQGSWFHLKDRFFRFNGIDLIVDNSKFSDDYEKIIVGDFFWGYNDKDLFNQSLAVIDTLPEQKRLDIYFTGTSHSPFSISDQPYYDSRFDSIVSTSGTPEQIRLLSSSKTQVQSLLFADDALHDFFSQYSLRPEYDSTIFIITGDHPMTELPIANSLKRYHVPLLIYSPMLKGNEEFTGAVSHLDIYETVLSFLADYNISVPPVTSALGGKLSTSSTSERKKIPFMSDNREIIDYYSDGYFLAGGDLFFVNSDLTLSPMDSVDLKDRMLAELDSIKRLDLYVSLFDGLLPDSIYCKHLGYKMLYSSQDSPRSAAFGSEFHTLLELDSVRNKPMQFELSFHHSSRLRDPFYLVYQLSTNTDSVALWQNTGIDRSRYQANFSIPQLDTPDSTLRFKIYFWNKWQQQFSYDQMRILVYQ